MQTPSTSCLFTRWQDPQTGVVSWIVNQRVAPLQQTFYFVNRSWTHDGRYLWFWCAFPPSASAQRGRTLARIDFQHDSIAHFPETQFDNASPMVDLETGEVYWASHMAVYRRSPDVDGVVSPVNMIPRQWLGHRHAGRTCTHLTRSADGRCLAIDPQIGNQWWVGEMPLDGSDCSCWHRFDEHFNHAQFSPVDPDCIMLANDWRHDLLTGQFVPATNRIWLIKRGQSPRPVVSDPPLPDRRAHEWWSADGRRIWYVDYDRGTGYLDLAEATDQIVWPGGTCHSHANASGDLLVGDIGVYQWEREGCYVSFYNVRTDREVRIASRLPLPDCGRSQYHVDPHPQFCLNDRYICYTTTVRGCVDVALTEVAALRSMTE